MADFLNLLVENAYLELEKTTELSHFSDEMVASLLISHDIDLLSEPLEKVISAVNFYRERTGK